ncbi:hypothetical protein, partial [Solihabitans fulvus]
MKFFMIFVLALLAMANAQGNGYEPIDNRPYIVNPPKDYNPNGNGYEPIDNGAYYVDPPQGRPYFK